MALITLAVVGAAIAIQPIPSTKDNFFQAGTQPGTLETPLVSPFNCAACHGDYNLEWAPFNRWANSMMAQSARDPVFHAALAIAEQDASFAGESCLRCHAPGAWLAEKVKFEQDPQSPNFGKHQPLDSADLLGVACSICHRMVDPEFQSGVSPDVDIDVLFGLATGIPLNPHNASMIIDPSDRRRGPFNLDADWYSPSNPDGFPDFHGTLTSEGAKFLRSPFHQSSRLCATCHDVSTAHFSKQTSPSGVAYTLNPIGEHPNPDKYQQFPEQRTFSEWSQSLFGQGPVNLSGRFGGTRLSVSSCQDCHMPGIAGDGCALNPPHRPALPQHNFAGANTWVLKAVRDLYPDYVTGLDESSVQESVDRNVDMLQKASDLEVTASGGVLNVRIINFSGHKLPTGYNEGRRMWINVKFRNSVGQVVAERGAYDGTTATLSTVDTKVYEAKYGIDAALGAQLGIAPGQTFRLALSNKIYKDNRIPPMGFSNAAFSAVQASHEPPNQYADGQYWDDTPFLFAAGARSAEVTVYYQTSSREYMEFLRDANVSNSRGQTAYDLWLAHGKSAPVVMDSRTITLYCRCDWRQSGSVTVQDIFDFLADWFTGHADFNGSGATTVQDIFDFLSCWFGGCAGN